MRRRRREVRRRSGHLVSRVVVLVGLVAAYGLLDQVARPDLAAQPRTVHEDVVRVVGLERQAELLWSPAHFILVDPQVPRRLDRSAPVYRYDRFDAQQRDVLLAGTRWQVTRESHRRGRSVQRQALATAHLSSVLPTSSMQPHLVPPVITHALVVRTAALRPRSKAVRSRLSGLKPAAPPVTLMRTLAGSSFHTSIRVSTAASICDLSRSSGMMANLAGKRSVFGKAREPAFLILSSLSLAIVASALAFMACTVPVPCRVSAGSADD